MADGERAAYSHTLSVRLTEKTYRALRKYVNTVEESTGRRMTHQAVLEIALTEYLGRARTPTEKAAE